MPLISDAAAGWSDPVTLTADEIWQVRRGVAFLSTAASPGADDGFRLGKGDGVLIRSGKAVRYRAGGGGLAPLIAREEV
jgi:hypothetical protein